MVVAHVQPVQTGFTHRLSQCLLTLDNVLSKDPKIILRSSILSSNNFSR